MKRLVYIFLTCVVFFACRKENDNPQWDIAVIGPLLKATLTIDQLIADSTLTSDGSGAQIIDYNYMFQTFNLDTIANVPDTSIRTSSIFPINGTIQPGQPFTFPNNNIVLGLGNMLLKQAVIRSGIIRLEIKNTLHGRIIFTYTIPKAKLNGVPFTASITVDSGSISNPQFYSHDYDLSGYDFDLTGSNGNTYNTISYVVQAKADPTGVPFAVNALDTVINLTTSLLSLQPSYAKGYLGQDQNSSSALTILEFTENFKSGLLKLDSINADLELINSIGADAQFYINTLNSINTRTGITVPLNAPNVVQHYININRATETNNPADPVAPTTYTVHLDNTNSNILAFIENLPNQIYSDFNIKINPLGNASGSNDFIYTDRLLDTRFKVIMPLRFAMNQLVFADTVPFSISNAANFDPVGDATLTLVANNGFPIDFNLQLFLLDTNNVVTDSLFTNDFIARAPVDANYRSIGYSRSEIEFTIDAARKEKLLSVDRVGIRLKCNTPDYPQVVQMYTDYKLDLKLIADGIYTIR